MVSERVQRRNYSARSRRQVDMAGNLVLTAREFVCQQLARERTRERSGRVADGLLAAFAADTALKETRLSSDEQLLTSLVLTLCDAGSSRRAA